MLKMRMAVAVGVLALCAHAMAEDDKASKEQSQQLWFDALFDIEGKVVELKPVDEASQPKGLWEQLGSRFKSARIQPIKTADGQPATFRTGMRITLGVNRDASGAGSVRLKDMSMVPVVLEQYVASYPKDVSYTQGWEGNFTAVCTIGTEGRCIKVEVKATPGMPESVRRFARTSMEGWRFIPQEINGQPIEGEYIWAVSMKTLEYRPKNFLDIRKL